MNNNKIDKKVKFLKITFECIFWAIVLTLLIMAILGVSVFANNKIFQGVLSQITLWLAILNTPLTFIKIKSNLFFVFVKRKLLKLELEKKERQKKKEKIDMLNLKEKRMLKLLKDKKIKTKINNKQELINKIKELDNNLGITLNDYDCGLILEWVKKKKEADIAALILSKSDVMINFNNIKEFINNVSALVD